MDIGDIKGVYGVMGPQWYINGPTLSHFDAVNTTWSIAFYMFYNDILMDLPCLTLT